MRSRATSTRRLSTKNEGRRRGETKEVKKIENSSEVPSSSNLIVVQRRYFLVNSLVCIRSHVVDLTREHFAESAKVEETFLRFSFFIRFCSFSKATNSLLRL